MLSMNPAQSKVEDTALSTKKRILNAAEHLFVEKGFAATSLRAISSLAEVNLSATHYHFGSKEGLFAAVIHRRVHPVNASRVKALETLTQGVNVLSVDEIITAFLSPFSGELPTALPRLMARVHGEPPALVRPLLQEEFGQVMNLFLKHLAIALPALGERELRWRFHFMIGAMMQLLNGGNPLEVEPDESTFSEGLEKLKLFVIAGFKAPTASMDLSREKKV